MIEHIESNLQNVKAIPLQRYAFYKLHIRPPSMSFTSHWVYRCMVHSLCVNQQLFTNGSLFNHRQALEDTRSLRHEQDAAMKASVKY